MIKNTETIIKIAPKIGYCDSWTNIDWVEAKSSSDWKRMIQIFSDRMNGRYLVFMREMKDKPYSGFAIMSLGCALLETLNQFYNGINDSKKATYHNGKTMTNSDFFVQFLSESSFIFHTHFKDRNHSRLFYKHFRCGLLHQAETKSNSKIRRKKGEILFEPIKGGLIVYRDVFLEILEQEFSLYKDHLLNDDIRDLRINFCNKMDYICRMNFDE
jgi:hypothetical protein